MSRIFITGDTHGEIDVFKLNARNFPEGRNLTKDDYVIICGDFGCVWGGSQLETSKYWQKWLETKPWTTLFVCGNHEDFDLLNSYPVTEWHGGKVHKINDSIYHLMRGEIYDIDGLSIFTFGGAFSHDRYWRTEHISWWQNELPNHDEVNNALDNLEKVRNKVDIIITHDISDYLRRKIGYGEDNNMKPYDSCYEDINKVLEEIHNTNDYQAWFAGHYHINKNYGKTHILYDKIIEITKDKLYQNNFHEIED